MNKPVKKIKKYLWSITANKSTTIAGGMTFFVVLAITPFAFLISYVLSLLNIDFLQYVSKDNVFLFNKIKNYLFAIVKEAKSSVTLTFVVAAVYSSSTLFYHLQKSGEILYKVENPRMGFIARILAIALTFICCALLCLCVVVGVAINIVVKQDLFANIASCVFYVWGAFIIVLIINVTVCPYKISLREVALGSVFTVAFWIVGTIGFALYTKYFSDFSKLYGTASFLIVFLLWLYIMMQGVVMGIVINVVRLGKVKSSLKRSNKVTLNKVLAKPQG